MREEIFLNINNPGYLEGLYRANKPSFKSAFNALYPELRSNPLAEGWYQRLNYRQEEMRWGTPRQQLFVVAASLLAALIAKLPEILSLDPEFFYTRNIGFIVFPILTAYFGWKNRISLPAMAWLTALTLISLIFINLLPSVRPGDTLNLSCIHLPLLLWAMLGFAFGGGKLKDGDWAGFLRYNGELGVMMALLIIAGGLTTGLTVGLFQLIGLQIQHFYFNYIVICGLAALPIVGTFLTSAQPALVGRVSPVIASLFSPVALVMLIIYLGAMVFSGKDPYYDRDFLLIFNALLVGVMALVFFSVAESDQGHKNSIQVLILFLLATVTLVVNGIALSAVVFRIAEWGITPNRAAVLGANVLMLLHLLYVGLRLLGVILKKNDLSVITKSLAVFVPVYMFWAAVVTFLFPFIFGFK